MPIVLILALFLLFIKGKGTDPPKIFSTDTTDLDTITVSTGSLGGNAPAPVNNGDGTVTITATLTKAKAQTIAIALVNKFKDWSIGEMDVMNLILQGKNDADYALIYAAFGKHEEEIFLPVLHDGILGTGDHDLTYWVLKKVVSEHERLRLHNRFKSIF